MKHKNKLLSWQEYQTLREKLQNFNEQPTADSKDAYLQTYNDLLKLREQGFPLLLQEGEAFVFDSPPVNAYLLPPLKSKQAPRWLLVFFVTDDEQSWVQLLTWHTDDNTDTQIQALAGQARQLINNCTHRLDQRPIDLHFVETGSTCTISLIFPQGELTLVANADLGIIVNAWQNKANTNVWIERYSYGEMKPAVKIRRYGDANKRWQDDVIEDVNGAVFLGGDALSLP